MPKQLLSTGARAVVINAQQQVLLHRRRDFGVWAVPGGRVEPYEQPDSAAVRETREETGYDVAIVHLIGEYGRPTTGQGHEYIYRAQVVGGQPMRSGPETRAVRWFPLTALPWAMSTAHRTYIRDALEAPAQPLQRTVRLSGAEATVIRVARWLRDARRRWTRGS